MREGTYEWLMKGSLGEMDISNLRAKQVEHYKAKLNSRARIQNGGSVLASDALLRKKAKEIKAAEEALKKARIAVRVAESKAAEALRQLGVADREEERKRKKFVKEQLVKQGRGIVAPIPPYMLIPIRDR